jgi:hypothetical protein
MHIFYNTIWIYKTQADILIKKSGSEKMQKFQNIYSLAIVELIPKEEAC